MLPDHFSLLAPFYEKFIPPKVSEKLQALVGLPTSGVLLDAGGGTGRVSGALRTLAGQVVVADLSCQMLREAAKKGGLNPVCTPGEALPFANGTFARIIMVDALHHVHDQAQTAAEFWRLLQPGGRIVIEEPDIRHCVVKLIALGEKLLLMRSHFLSPRQIAALFHFPNAAVSVEAENGAAWVIVEKLMP